MQSDPRNLAYVIEKVTEMWYNIKKMGKRALNMNSEQLISELAEVLKKHAKKPEDITNEEEKAAAAYFTDDKQI